MKHESVKCDPIVSDLSGRPVKFVRSALNYNRDQASLEVSLGGFEPTMAQQQFKEECDINNIAKNFGLTGRLPENVRMPMYGDFADVDDYQSALNAARRASQSFMAMPANVRERFKNDPQQFLAFCSDDANRAEAQALGLVRTDPVSAQIPPPPDAPKPM